MLKTVQMSNLGPLNRLTWSLGPRISAIIGANDTGKTLLLKMLYACVRAMEAWRRGDDARTIRQILDEKLTWTFQLPTLGDLVAKGQEGPLGVSLEGESLGRPLELSFAFSRKAKKGVGELKSELEPLESTSLFIPAKEVLSLMAVIKESRQAKKFGFDDPTYDLVQALERAPSRGNPPFGDARGAVQELVGGRIQERRGEWFFERSTTRQRFPVAITAEGIKKIAILDRLIVNRSLTETSVLFVDEPESFLHPRALVRFLEILDALTDHGLQVVLATHSLTALRKLAVLAQASDRETPLLSLRRDRPPAHSDLRFGLSKNPLSDASVALYEEELGLAPMSADAGTPSS